MALHDEILVDIIRGIIPFRFKINDLKKRKDRNNPQRYIVGNNSYAVSGINTIPWNHSISKDGLVKGDYVKKGRAPKFYRLENKEFELILTESHIINIDYFEDDEGPEGASETLVKGSPSGPTKPPVPPVAVKTPPPPDDDILNNQNLDPIEIILRYVETVPYQKYFRKQRITHPQNPVIGWTNRLTTYFWPDQYNNWNVNTIQLNRFINALSGLNVNNLNQGNNPTLLLNIFSAICVWGNVRLPEPNTNILTNEVITVLNALDNNQVPVNCRLNSAWTKLYAMFRPNKFMIFDSRVGTALTSILDPYMPALINSPLWQPYTGLGTVNIGRGGSRPRQYTWNWPNGYQNWAAQIAANKIAIALQSKLNSNAEQNNPNTGNSRNWIIREIEGILFMEGY